MADDSLERKLGYRFSDPNLLLQALTHRSHSSRHNERLEFLGDAALGYVIANWLYRAHQGAREQDLTLMRANLVKGETLTAIAREIDLGECLRLGQGEKRSGGHQRASILADTLEAVFGAVLEDGGIEAARSVIERLFAARLESAGNIGGKDPKTQLQEHLQGRRLPLPVYVVVAQEGDAHEPRFTVECQVAALSITGRGEASSRRDAEKVAAQAVLAQLVEA